MKLLKRNTIVFELRKHLDEQETLQDGMHTGNFGVTYAEPVQYMGNLSYPSGVASQNMFGLVTDYTHVMLVDSLKADIGVDDLIVINGHEYDVRAVRRSLNVLSLALKMRTESHVTASTDQEDDG